MNQPIHIKHQHTIHQQEKPVTGARLVFYIFSVLLFIAVIYYFPEIKKEVNLLKQENMTWLLLAIIGQALTYLFNAIIYHDIMQAYRIKDIPPLKKLYKASVIALFFNQTVPSAGISGNTYLFNFLRKQGSSAPQVLSIIMVELLVFYFAMEVVILLCLAGVYFFRPAPILFAGTLLAGFIVYLILASLILLTGRKASFQYLYKQLEKWRILSKLKKRAGQLMRSAGNSHEAINVLEYIKRGKQSLRIFCWQVVIIALDSFTILALFYGFGVPVSFYTAILVLTCAKVISLLPFSPGALILYESSMTYLFSLQGFPLSTALIITLLYRLLSFWLPMPVGLLLYRKWLTTEKKSTRYSAPIRN